MIDEVPIPRSRSGQRMYHVTRGYVVLVDTQRNEVSRRIHGDAHAVFNRHSRVDLVFVPDEVGAVELEAETDSVGHEMRDSDGEFVWGHDQRVWKRGCVLFDFDANLDRILM